MVHEVGGAALKLREKVLLGNATSSACLERKVHQAIQGCSYPCREIINMSSEEVDLGEGREGRQLRQEVLFSQISS